MRCRLPRQRSHYVILPKVQIFKKRQLIHDGTHIFFNFFKLYVAKRRTCGSIMNQLLLKGQCSRHVSRQSSYLNLPIFGQESKVYHNNLQTRLSLHAATSMAGKYVSNKTWVALILKLATSLVHPYYFKQTFIDNSNISSILHVFKSPLR